MTDRAHKALEDIRGLLDGRLETHGRTVESAILATVQQALDGTGATAGGWEAAWAEYVSRFDGGTGFSLSERRAFAQGYQMAAARALVIAEATLADAAVMWADMSFWPCHAGTSPGDPSKCGSCRRIMVAREALAALRGMTT